MHSDCEVLTALLKGVLQRADVQKVDVMDNWDTMFDPIAVVISCECECVHACMPV